MSITISQLAEIRDVPSMQAGKWPKLYAAKYALLTSAAGYGPAIPPAERVILCDISKWNGLVNFGTMAGAGAEGFYCKATQGTTWVDGQYLNSWKNSVGILPLGAYHFLTIADGATQGVNFCNTIGDNPGNFPPTIDVELKGMAGSIIKACALVVTSRFGDYPLIYTSKYFWDMVSGAADKAWIADHCGLWVAHWGTDTPLLPTGWSNYVLHQYSADGNKRGLEFGAQAGYEPDMDLDRCRRSWLEQYQPPVDPLEARVTALEWEARAHGWNV